MDTNGHWIFWFNTRSLFNKKHINHYQRKLMAFQIIFMMTMHDNADIDEKGILWQCALKFMISLGLV